MEEICVGSMYISVEKVLGGYIVDIESGRRVVTSLEDVIDLVRVNLTQNNKE